MARAIGDSPLRTWRALVVPFPLFVVVTSLVRIALGTERVAGGTSSTCILNLEIADQSGEKLELILWSVPRLEILDIQLDGMSKILVDSFASSFDACGNVLIGEKLRVTGRQSCVDVNERGMKVIHALHGGCTEARGAMLMHIFQGVLSLFCRSLERFGADVPGECARTV